MAASAAPPNSCAPRELGHGHVLVPWSEIGPTTSQRGDRDAAVIAERARRATAASLPVTRHVPAITLCTDTQSGHAEPDRSDWIITGAGPLVPAGRVDAAATIPS